RRTTVARSRERRGSADRGGRRPPRRSCGWRPGRRAWLAWWGPSVASSSGGRRRCRERAGTPPDTPDADRDQRSRVLGAISRPPELAGPWLHHRGVRWVLPALRE